MSYWSGHTCSGVQQRLKSLDSKLVSVCLSLSRGCLQAATESYRVPLDDKVEVYSWADDLLFLCKRSLDRSIGTQCLLAAQATLNNVYGNALCCERIVGRR
jgi:hypothetical protein